MERQGREGAQLSWQRFERDEPALADAAVRLHLAGLADLPEGAQVREQHRHPPTAEDWIALIGDYCRNCLLPSDDPRDASAYEAIRRALPAVGYRLTRAGVRAADSPVGPRTRRPPTAGFSALNAVMLQRPAARETARADWAVGTPYQDEPVATVTVSARRPLGLAGRAVVPVSRRHRTRPWQVAGLATAVSALVLLSAQPVADAAATSLVAAACGLAVSRTAVRIGRAGGSSCLADLAAATADALHTVGLTSQDASAVRVEVLPDGSYRARLQDVPAGEAATFSTALEEVLSPLAQPRYVIPRLIVAPPGGPGAVLGLTVRRLITGGLPATVVYHAVPATLGVNKERAAAFERAWHARVSPGAMLFTGSPEGTGILAAQRGDDPFAVTTQIRTLWR